jgi:hypothetical protein
MRAADRKQALREQYHFECLCSPCCSPSQAEYQERSFGLLCPQCEGPLLSCEGEGGKHVLTCSDCSHVQHAAKLIKMDLVAHGHFTQGEFFFWPREDVWLEAVKQGTDQLSLALVLFIYLTGSIPA